LDVAVEQGSGCDLTVWGIVEVIVSKTDDGFSSGLLKVYLKSRAKNRGAFICSRNFRLSLSLSLGSIEFSLVFLVFWNPVTNELC